MNKQFLITGATGNVGLEVINSLSRMDHQLDIYAGVRDPVSDQKKFTNTNIYFSKFDFMDPRTYGPALSNCQILFLLRPPQISDVEKYFKPIIEVCKEKHVEHIVFLSVQGVEKSSIIPHHKIEKLIVDSQIPYTFLRPAYFMQNFTTMLRSDLVNKKLIYLPAGKAKFTLIDVRDIGAVAAVILQENTKHVNMSYELTNTECLGFSEMAKYLSENLGTKIEYQSPNLLAFFLRKRKEKLPTAMIFVMMMLHFLPRFQKDPPLTDWVLKITGQEPTTLKQFVLDHKNLF